jgi:catechol 2,3-dioxygenase-like lactoylglutathione lyase family enzyme
VFKEVHYIMVTVSDMKRSIEFYRDKLGLPLKFESPGWSEFLTGASTLALHGGGKPQPGASAADPETPYAGTCSIGFSTSDLEKTFEELKARGVDFVMPPTRRDQEGIKLAVCTDPDGLPVSFAQMLEAAKPAE